MTGRGNHANIPRAPAAGYPVNLLLADRPVLVIGGGTIAARKAAALAAEDARITVVAPVIGDEMRALAARHPILLVERPFEPGDLDGMWLAFTATDDAAVNRAVFEAGEARHVFVNAADDPRHCSFTLLSIMRRGDLQVAIGTAGRSPALAAWLKAKLADELGPEYEILLDLLAEEREALRANGQSSEDADWRRALDSGILELIRAGKVPEAKERLRSCLSSSSA